MPTHFTENFLNYSFTNSKTIIHFVGSRSAVGSNTYIVNWLNNQAYEPIQFPQNFI